MKGRTQENWRIIEEIFNNFDSIRTIYGHVRPLLSCNCWRSPGRVTEQFNNQIMPLIDLHSLYIVLLLVCWDVLASVVVRYVDSFSARVAESKYFGGFWKMLYISGTLGKFPWSPSYTLWWLAPEWTITRISWLNM